MSISIDNYSAKYNELYQNSTSSSSLSGALDKDYSNATDEELMDVCKDFEAYFTEQMFKALKSMVPENEEQSSSQSSGNLDYFEDMLNQEYANNVTDGEGLGIAKMLYEQMKRNYDL